MIKMSAAPSILHHWIARVQRRMVLVDNFPNFSNYHFLLCRWYMWPSARCGGYKWPVLIATVSGKSCLKYEWCLETAKLRKVKYSLHTMHQVTCRTSKQKKIKIIPKNRKHCPLNHPTLHPWNRVTVSYICMHACISREFSCQNWNNIQPLTNEIYSILFFLFSYFALQLC